MDTPTLVVSDIFAHQALHEQNQKVDLGTRHWSVPSSPWGGGGGDYIMGTPLSTGLA